MLTILKPLQATVLTATVISTRNSMGTTMLDINRSYSCIICDHDVCWSKLAVLLSQSFEITNKLALFTVIVASSL